jgi:hypothetical protein
VTIDYIFGIKKLTINFVAENDGELSGEEDFAEVKVEHQVIFVHRALLVFYFPLCSAFSCYSQLSRT